MNEWSGQARNVDQEFHELTTAGRDRLLKIACMNLNRDMKNCAEDIVQEILCTTWRRRYDIRVPFSAFAFRGTIFLCWKHNKGAGWRNEVVSPYANDKAFKVLQGMDDTETSVLRAQLLALIDERDRPDWRHAFETGQHRFSGNIHSKEIRISHTRAMLRKLFMARKLVVTNHERS